MATLGVRRPKYVSGKCEVRSYPEAASQSFKNGAFVTLNTSGQVLVSPDDADYVFGLALSDATGTTNEPILVLLCNCSTIFSANLCTSGSVAATAQTRVGDIIGLDYNSTYGFHLLNTASATLGTNACAKIVDLFKGDTVADTGGRVLFKFIDQANQTMTPAGDADGLA